MLKIFRFPLPQRRLRGAIVRFLCALCLTLAFQQMATAAQSQAIKRATITQVLDSSQVFIQNKQARVNDSALRGQRVRTGQARAQLRFNNGAVGRLAHNSVLTVGQCAQLQQGALLVNGAMTGCTSSVVAGVRGTTYVLEVKAAGETRVRVLEGEVALRRTPNSLVDRRFYDRSSTNPVWVTLKAGEQVSITAAGQFGLVEKLTQADFKNLLNGSLFKGFAIPLPGTAKVQQSFRQLFPGVPFPVRTIPNVQIPPIRLPIKL